MPGPQITRESPGVERGGAAHLRLLGPLLCWAIVYADIGTSIYYVPGILYHGVGPSAPSFVLATGIVFVLLAEKYTEIAARYAGGGGVVSVASEAFGPRTGALGGMLILVDYFLTAAISAVSGFAYLASLLPAISGFELPLAIAGLLLLGLLNWVGIRESASVAVIVGSAAFLVLLILLAATTLHVDRQQWSRVADSLFAAGRIPLGDAAVGFAAAWLAFSGLESLSQISPAMADPRRRTARRAMGLVVVAMLLTAPLLTAFATNVIDPASHNPDALQSELGFAMGGTTLRVLVVTTASALLLFASNTAIVGAYHVFGALADGNFLPGALLARSPRFGTPTIAIMASVMVPIAVLFATRGRIDTLAQLYAFGLLGAFSLSSISLDRVRMAEGRTDLSFFLGLATTLLVLVAWVTNLISKPYATAFGGVFTLVMWSYGLLHRTGLPGRRALAIPAEQAEEIAAARPSAARILTLAEALELEAAFGPKTLVALRGNNERLLEEVAAHLAGRKEWSTAVLYVDEVPGLFVPRDTEPSREARQTLEEATAWFDARSVTALPIWRIAQDAGEAIAHAAARLDVEAVFVGTSQRGTLWRMLRGNVIGRLISRAPTRTRIVIVG